ncbi:MAG: CoA transferase [Hyphomonadaceae bacterium]|nr:CoA transferase [Hyphomonadaceae bacterium]
MRDIEMLADYAPRPKDAPHLLEGVRVVDFTQFIAGPYATLILADFGADVLKIERPGVGDGLRILKGAQIAGGDGGAFLWANRNKRGLALDLATPAGRDVAFELMKQADVVVENFSAQVMKRLGLDYDAVAAVNPGIVYCTISAAGRTGPMSGRTAFDPVTQAESGFVALNAVAGAPARSLTTPIADLTSGMMAATTILAALAGRSRLGRGQQVEIAMYDQGINLLAYAATDYLISGEEPAPRGAEKHPAPAGIFVTKDKDILLCCASDGTFRKLMSVIGREDLAADARFSNLAARTENAPLFLDTLSGILAEDTQANWLARMRAAGVPVAPVASLGEALTGPDIEERALVSRIPHPVAGWAPHIAPPYRLGLTPVVDPVAAPGLGQHTREVLGEVLGYGEEALDALAASGAFGRQDDKR